MTQQGIEKQADDVYGKYFDIWVNSDMTIKLTDFIKIVIQDRKSVLDVLNRVADTTIVDKAIQNEIQSITKQIEYLKTKI